MRKAPLVFTAGLLAMSIAHAVAEPSSTAALELRIQQKQSDYQTYLKDLAAIDQSIRSEQEELKRLQGQTTELEQQRKAALLHMDKQYEALVEDPSLDISEAQKGYQYAIQAVKRNQDKIGQQQAKLSDYQRRLAESETVKFSMINELENLKEELNYAKVDDLRRQFSDTAEFDISQTIACGGDMTLNQCASQGKQQARQTASKQYLERIHARLKESNLTVANGGMDIRVVSEKVVSSGFSGQGNYAVDIKFGMQAALNAQEACRMLKLDQRYCARGGQTVSGTPVNIDSPTVVTESIEADSAKKPDVALFQVVIRSNVFDDEVFIDGVSYGSTKVEAMLPAGKHNIVVKKQGYESFSKSVDIRGDQLVRATLERIIVELKRGEKAADALAKGGKGPLMVGIGSGSYRVGDINASGFGNEAKASNISIGKVYGIGVSEITVAQFRQFVQETGYKTTAEKSGGCAIYVDGRPEMKAQYNWQNPGFSQADNHPVVCVSSADAKAYTGWLSSATGYNYRLPTENEWEVAARGGSNSDYWWGDNVGNNRANCGWCGSSQSNKGTSSVAGFAANRFGLHDTVGNVWELTSGRSPVARGGSWNFAPSLARVSARLEVTPDFRANYIGFRVVREQ